MRKNKLWYGGTTQDIDELAFKFRQGMLAKYLRLKQVEQERLDIHDWLKWIVEHLGGTIRYCDPFAGAFSETYCEHHCVIHVIEEGNFELHCSAVMSFMYNNFEILMGLGYYFFNYERKVGGEAFFYRRDDFAWQARRFAAAFLIPKPELLDYLKHNGRTFNPNVLTLRNYEDYAKHFAGSAASHFCISRDPAIVRLSCIFKELAEQKHNLIENITTA